ncbi:MAG: hypothetical protein IJ702_05630 [Fretibacterium sp.]|nr:hypothetical protein [Fretibacterium sp.]
MENIVSGVVIALLSFCTYGIALVVFLLLLHWDKDEEILTMGICQNCGHTWEANRCIPHQHRSIFVNIVIVFGAIVIVFGAILAIAAGALLISGMIS